jgi:hypothetical protein
LTVTVYRPRDPDDPKQETIAIISGVWDKKTGGEVDSEETLYHPGGMVDPISLGGRKNVGNLVLTRLCKIERDWYAIPSLVAAVGRSKVTVGDQAMDIDGNAVGTKENNSNPLTYNGILKRVTPPEVDSESSGAALIEIEVTVNGYPS